MSFGAVVLAVSDVGYVAAGWLLTFGLVGGYAWLVTWRGRRLSRELPPEERRWS